MLYDIYLRKQILMDKFDPILKKLYRMLEAELSVVETVAPPEQQAGAI